MREYRIEIRLLCVLQKVNTLRLGTENKDVEEILKEDTAVFQNFTLSSLVELLIKRVLAIENAARTHIYSCMVLTANFEFFTAALRTHGSMFSTTNRYSLDE